MSVITKRMLKIVACIAALFVVVLIVVGYVVVSSFGDLCANSIISETKISGTNYKIVVFYRDCGATTGFSTQASIIKLDSTLRNEGGNVFSADDSRGGKAEIEVKTSSPQSVEILYPSDTRIFKAEPLYKGIGLRYSNTLPEKVRLKSIQ